MTIWKASNARKFWRYVTIYGLPRTAYKTAGRLKLNKLGPRLARRKATVGAIGCGQFAFATMGYYVGKIPGGGIAACFDINPDVARRFGSFHRVADVASSASDVIANADVSIVYISSNHASHADYAVSVLSAGKKAYVEKPVAVSLEQLARLDRSVTEGGVLYVGYNRPFSKAVNHLRRRICCEGPLTLSCFVSGHVLALDHWYGDPKEGTRICGNLGHWLDLAVHMLCWDRLPDAWRITLAWSDPEVRDDNLSLSLTSERGDLVNIVLTARTEPFEGVNETINLQWGDAIVKIDDFRRMTLWQGPRLTRRRYWPKDLGHRAALLQPFRDEPRRPWREIRLSSLLMLKITDMVRRAERVAVFSFSEAECELNKLAAEALPSIAAAG